MTQNTSPAVMQQRHEAHDSLDDFPTPPWGTRALCEHVLMHLADGRMRSVWEPACNRGYMAKPLAEYFSDVHTSDIADYGWGGQERVCDFLFPQSEPEAPVDWVITNPPFRLAAQFIHRAREVARVGVAVIVRTSFLEGGDRYRTLFRETPPAIVAQFCERVPMVKGRYDPKISTATSYAWLVWLNGRKGPPEFRWIPPCRKQLERAGDVND